MLLSDVVIYRNKVHIKWILFTNFNYHPYVALNSIWCQVVYDMDLVLLVPVVILVVLVGSNGCIDSSGIRRVCVSFKVLLLLYFQMY